MRRLAAASTFLLVIGSFWTSSAHAQRPSAGGVRPLLGGTPPWIVLGAPTGSLTVYTQYPYIEIHFCRGGYDLDATSRLIKLNGVNKTSSFSYTSGDPGGLCGGTPSNNAYSATQSVALNAGANTLYAYICDVRDYPTPQCATSTWTITYSALPPAAPVITLRNQNGDNVDRGFCLTLGAGQAAGLSCGDLFVTHGLPGYETMGRSRSLTMFYNSAAAAPRPAVAVQVTQPGGSETPSTVYAELKVNNVVRASGTYTGFGPGATRQIVLAYDAKDDPSGIYDFSLLVRNNNAEGPYDATVTGSLIVANRSWSEFGAGWWLDGIEQLVTGQSGNRILWLGGDGSAAVYNNVATNTWLRAAGAFRDTLVYDPGSGTYTRTLEHGVQVVFNAAGRHIRTVGRTGQVSTMTWGAPPGYPSLTRLLSVAVPPAGVSGNTYSLDYQGTNQLVDWIQDPAGRRISPYVGTFLYGSKYAPTYITDADGNAASFTYDGIGRMTGRQTRRGYWTRYTYTGQLHVDSTKVPLSAAGADTAITTFTWWDEQGLSFNLVGGTQAAPPDTGSVYTKLFGPRRGVADDVTFIVDRFGQPLRITDPLGNVTTIVRADATNPALPTQVTYADGRIVKMTWNGRAHLVEMRDSTSHLGAAGLSTAVTRWTYTSPNTRDAPDSVIDPEGVVSRYGYNSWGLVSEAIAPNGHHTSVEYVPSGSLAGLVNAVTERSVTVYDSVANSRVVADLRSAFGFNALGNVMSDTTPAGRVTTLPGCLPACLRGVRPGGRQDVHHVRPHEPYDEVRAIHRERRFVDHAGALRR